MESDTLFHERQHLEQCLLHTLNNLFQERCFTSADLNELADNLAPGTLPFPGLHPHRTIFLGSWDVNVLECALKAKGKEMRWHDVRDVEFISLDPAACFGLIVNVKNRSPAWPLSVLFKERRHWFALRCISGVWYNLDSKLREPQRLTGNAGHDVGPRDESAGTCALAGGETTAVVLREYLSQLAANNDAKVFIVT